MRQKHRAGDQWGRLASGHLQCQRLLWKQCGGDRRPRSFPLSSPAVLPAQSVVSPSTKLCVAMSSKMITELHASRRHGKRHQDVHPGVCWCPLPRTLPRELARKFACRTCERSWMVPPNGNGDLRKDLGPYEGPSEIRKGCPSRHVPNTGWGDQRQLKNPGSWVHPRVALKLAGGAASEFSIRPMGSYTATCCEGPGRSPRPVAAASVMVARHRKVQAYDDDKKEH
jgi:hypothetical protein